MCVAPTRYSYSLFEGIANLVSVSVSLSDTLLGRAQLTFYLKCQFIRMLSQETLHKQKEGE